VIGKLLFGILLLALIGVGTGLYLWNKPHAKVENAKSVVMTAEALSKEYNTNEKKADSLYLNKAIEVSGTVSEIEKNQDGGIMVVLATDDPMAGVQCTMREKNVAVTKGAKVVIKGFCSGNGITGVSLTDCVMKNTSNP